MRPVVILAFAPIVLLAMAARAQAPSGMAPGGCRLIVEPVEFGFYSPLATAPRTSTGRIEVACVRNVLGSVSRVALSTGSSGVYVQRSMLLGDVALHYNLYVDFAHERVAGDGTGNSFTLTPNPLGSRAVRQGFPSLGASSAIFRVYGAIPPHQLTPPGDYLDVIQVEVEF